MKIPPEVQLKATLRPGSVYYFVEETFASREPHYFIVLNCRPATDDMLILVCSSSQRVQVKQRIRRRGLPDNTLVEIDSGDYPDFTTDSIVNCNYVLKKTMTQLIEKLEQGMLQFKSVMDGSIVEKLRNGVLASPVVSEDIKKQYLR